MLLIDFIFIFIIIVDFISTSGTVEVTLDTYQGTLSYTDLDTAHGNYGVAFNGLKGLILIPAVSLFSADNSVTLATGL